MTANERIVIEGLRDLLMDVVGWAGLLGAGLVSTLACLSAFW